MSGETKAERAPSDWLGTAKRLVVKVGSELLADEAKGAIRHDWIGALAEDVAELRRRGRDVVLVSSGAIAIGGTQLGLAGRAMKLEEKQAAAGQIRLAHAYQEALERHGITVAQILLTLDDTVERRRYLNARGTIDTLLRLGAVPVINENDTVATDEIRFGDNDRLAARVAAMISADTLVLLSTVDGLYTADPERDPNATLVTEVRDITPEIAAMAGDAPPGYTSGGMVTKLEAAKIAQTAGCAMVIVDGRCLRPLSALAAGAPSTWFLPKGEPRSARKHWIAAALRPAGVITVDDGALRALQNGKSLLPAGVTAIEGAFERGDAVSVATTGGEEAARGLSAYSAADARRIMGHKSREIQELLGYRGRDEMIHRDNLVMLIDGGNEPGSKPG
ncbi:MAG: glutamate 5-kinase [Alphaproteobacteria bacterium]|nr:glutamate 5-kinase [Alphaproteobacteria bacterium]